MSEDPEGTWPCPQCTFHNKNLAPVCGMCGFVKPQIQPISQTLHDAMLLQAQVLAQHTKSGAESAKNQRPGPSLPPKAQTVSNLFKDQSPPVPRSPAHSKSTDNLLRGASSSSSSASSSSSGSQPSYAPPILPPRPSLTASTTSSSSSLTSPNLPPPSNKNLPSSGSFTSQSPAISVQPNPSAGQKKENKENKENKELKEIKEGKGIIPDEQFIPINPNINANNGPSEKPISRPGFEQILSMRLWDRPDQAFARCKLGGKSGAYLETFLKELKKIELSYGQALFTLGTKYMEADEKSVAEGVRDERVLDLGRVRCFFGGKQTVDGQETEGKTLTSAFTALVLQAVERGAQLTKYAQTMDKILSQKTLSEVDKSLVEPTKRYQREIKKSQEAAARDEQNLIQFQKKLEKLQASVIKNAVKVHKQIDPNNWKQYVPQKKVKEIQEIDAKIKAATIQLTMSNETLHSGITSYLDAFQQLEFQRVESLYGTMAIVGDLNKNLSAALLQKSMSTLQRVRNVNRERDLKDYVTSVESGVLCPWLTENLPFRDRPLSSIQTPKTMEPNVGGLGEPLEGYDEKDLQSPDHNKIKRGSLSSAPNSALQMQQQRTGKIALRKRITPIHDPHPPGTQKFNTPLKKKSNIGRKRNNTSKNGKKTFRQIRIC